MGFFTKLFRGSFTVQIFNRALFYARKMFFCWNQKYNLITFFEPEYNKSTNFEPKFRKKIKKLDFCIKLDTNATLFVSNKFGALVLSYFGALLEISVFVLKFLFLC